MTQNQSAEDENKSLHLFQAIIFFWWPIDFVSGGLWRGRGGGGGGGVRLCLPVRAAGPLALFRCDACVLSLAWLECLHLMVYSYSAVQDAVPWGSSHTQYVCEEVTERRSESRFLPYGRFICFALVFKIGTAISFKVDQHHSPSLFLPWKADVLQLSNSDFTQRRKCVVWFWLSSHFCLFYFLHFRSFLVFQCRLLRRMSVSIFPSHQLPEFQWVFFVTSQREIIDNK